MKTLLAKVKQLQKQRSMHVWVFACIVKNAHIHTQTHIHQHSYHRYDELVEELRKKFTDELVRTADKLRIEREHTASLQKNLHRKRVASKRQLEEAGNTIAILRKEKRSVCIG